MSDYDAVREIRRGPGGDGIVLIALSGYGRPEDKAKALEAGFDGHLTKPVDPEALTKILSELEGFRRTRP